MKHTSTPTGWRDRSLAVSYLDELPDPVVVLDRESRVCESNEAFAQFAAVSREMLPDQPIRQALRHATHTAPFIDAAERMAREPNPERVLLKFQGADEGGAPQTMLVTAIPIQNDAGASLLAIRMEDITEMVRERAESEAERLAAHESARALERLNEELEGFSYSVAHDLRAPLRFIDKFAYLLMEHHSHELSSEGLQFAEQIREGTRQMAQLVEDLLQFSQVTGQHLKREAIDMTRLVRQVVAKAEYEIEDRHVTFTVADLGTARGDANLVRQVFANLIGNAVKFTRRREKAVIDVGIVLRNGVPTYTVSDNGVGFDASEAERLFTVFQRFHQPDDFEGSGVGLAVVKRIVNRHGGAVWAESQIGQGARFYFTLAPGAAEHRGA